MSDTYIICKGNINVLVRLPRVGQVTRLDQFHRDSTDAEVVTEVDVFGLRGPVSDALFCHPPPSRPPSFPSGPTSSVHVRYIEYILLR